MRYRAVFPILMIIFALSGCTLSTINPIQKSRIDSIHHTQILFFSDEHQIDQEASYYDALLDLEKDYPDQIDKMKVYDNRKGWEDEIETVPTLMVVDQRHVVVKIEGCVKKKEDIIKPLQHVLSK
ncbi:peptidoglycan-associated lipoprotein Slp [Bacillus mojavensis]|uniref:peptidoglycan-associated lipoprotein Slp n=1 Tax=Bacillus mojavensis TaxID=72360 RepID=UPI002DB945DE|nr:peptidoglycan-associated lipoprotein Slp [Bacillus mojavensis]MEC1626296.1 peptidoglycan-associated lipoprotein Slp [Bacillus mojavensis]